MKKFLMLSCLSLAFLPTSLKASNQEFIEDEIEAIRKDPFYKVVKDTPAKFYYEPANPDGLEESVLLKKSIKKIQEILENDSNLSEIGSNRLEEELKILQELLKDKN